MIRRAYITGHRHVSGIKAVKLAVSIDSTRQCINRVFLGLKFIANWTARSSNGLRKALFAHLYSSWNRGYLRNDRLKYALLLFVLDAWL